jgi:hypothetical protein
VLTGSKVRFIPHFPSNAPSEKSTYILIAQMIDLEARISLVVKKT